MHLVGKAMNKHSAFCILVIALLLMLCPAQLWALANPAAKKCVDEGFRYEVRKNVQGGEYGVCIFKDNTECNDWGYFRSECKPGQCAKWLSETGCQEIIPEPKGESSSCGIGGKGFLDWGILGFMAASILLWPILSSLKIRKS